MREKGFCDSEVGHLALAAAESLRRHHEGTSIIEESNAGRVEVIEI